MVNYSQKHNHFLKEQYGKGNKRMNYSILSRKRIWCKHACIHVYLREKQSTNGSKIETVTKMLPYFPSPVG